MNDAVLSVRDLSVSFSTLRGKINVIYRLSLEIAPGEILGVVGESGSGKSVTALAVMRLLGPSGIIDGGTVTLAGKNLTAFTEEEMLKVRGVDVSMIFQEPMTSLNPVFTVGFQIAETLIEHVDQSKKQAMDEAVRLMELVGIPEARATMQRISAPVVRRDAAAGDDRHGAWPAGPSCSSPTSPPRPWT